MINKQTLRSGVTILVNGSSLSKEEIITISENWTEREENFFRKMLKQGGDFKIQNNKFRIIINIPLLEDF